jgi:5-methylcytosine-specific restriction endonuclease McrA
MPITKQCENCAVDYPVRPHRAAVSHFCSKPCNDLFKQVNLICEWCKEPYAVKRSHAEGSRFCKRACQLAWKKKHWVGENAPNYKHGNYTGLIDRVNCKICGKSFEQQRAYLSQGYGDICSIECRSLAKGARKGKDSAAWKPKITVTCEQCGETKEVTPSTAKAFRFCSKDCRNEWQSTSRMRGQNHHNWKGGISHNRAILMASREYKEWRRLVFERDQFACQLCGDARGGNLHAHHIKFYSLHPELALDVDNGLTLCEPCHLELHKAAKSESCLTNTASVRLLNIS